ncbi:unnamed protein product [Haemonchus placei]|uniref:Uncharacterized protein n=1 Tax=Haemonchus placei TaxID=6290 RepID=A0A3P7SSN2_HAEPC|nr:unnamed protein product [Haemonchus placei]
MSSSKNFGTACTTNTFFGILAGKRSSKRVPTELTTLTEDALRKSIRIEWLKGLSVFKLIQSFPKGTRDISAPTDHQHSFRQRKSVSYRYKSILGSG